VRSNDVLWTASASSVESGLSTVRSTSSMSPGESRTGDLLDSIAETQGAREADLLKFCGRSRRRQIGLGLGSSRPALG